MICDVHAHYTPKNFSEFMGDRFAALRRMGSHLVLYRPRLSEQSPKKLNNCR